MSCDTRSKALAVCLVSALALATGACKKDPTKAPDPPASLWAYAPPDLGVGIVIEPGAAGAVAEGLQELARIAGSYPASSTLLMRLRHEAFARVIDPFDRKFFKLSGLDPDGGFAMFLGEGGDDGFMILPIADRARFRSYSGMKKERRNGRDIDSDSGTVCAEFGSLYACGPDGLEVLDEAMGRREPEGLAARVLELPADVRGAIEIAVDPRRFVEPGDMPPELDPTLIFFAATLGEGVITLRSFMDGLPDQPYGVRNLPPSDAVADLGRGAVGIWRVGLDPAVTFEEFEPWAAMEELSRAVLDNLTGELVVITKGTGPAAGMIALGVKDVEAAREHIVRGCTQARAPGGQDMQLRAGACEGTMAVPNVGPPGTDPFGDALRGAPVSSAVIDDMLVFSLGHTITGRAVSPPELPDGNWALSMTLRSLDPLATAPEWSAVIQEGLELNAGREVAAAVTATRWMLAHVAELTVGARLIDDTLIIEATALTYGTDPPEVYDAYEAAVRKLLAYDVAGYLTSMAELAERPETRAGRQARLVGDRAPTMFPGIALAASAYVAASLGAAPPGVPVPEQ